LANIVFEPVKIYADKIESIKNLLFLIAVVQGAGVKIIFSLCSFPVNFLHL